MQKVEHLILGAGPAGIAAALRLGNRSKIIERGQDFGGQSGSIQIGEAVFDIGGHSFHTPHPFVRDLVYNSLEMFDQVRKAYCFSHDTLIPYPFQKSFRAIQNEEVVRECAEGLEQLDPNSTVEPKNFEEFIYQRFGDGIAKHFMLPYNQKLWARDLKNIETKWTGQRVAAPEGFKEKFDLTGGERKPLQSDTTVGYPAKGGFGEIYKALAKGVKDIEFGVEVQKVDVRNKIVYTNNGEYHYEHLISSIPVNELTKMMGSDAASVQGNIDKLDYMSLKSVMVAINHPVDTEVQRIYAADAEIPAHKTAINHNSSDWLRSRPHHGIMGEVSYSPYKSPPRLDLEDWFVDSLLRMGIIKSKSEVLATKTVDVRYAYPVPTHDRLENINAVKDFLREWDVHTVGRFGEWAYINSDEVLARGLILGEQLAGR